MSPLIIFLLISIPFCTSTHDSLCDAVLPFHGNEQPMTDFSPFTILTSSSKIEQNQKLTIQIEADLPGVKLGGYIIHARSRNPPYEIIGRFVSSNYGLKLISCDGVDNTAIYYVTSGSADNFELMWEAPSDYTGEVLFKATIAQQNGRFGVRVESVPVQIIPAMALIPPRAAIPALKRIVAALAEDFAPVIGTKQRFTDPIYEGCGRTKSCVGFPDGCVPFQGCLALATAVRIDTQFQFELQSVAHNVAYVALGLSRDRVMGDDSTTECVVEGGAVRAFTSWNIARPNQGNTRQGVPQNIISLLNATFVHGVIYCKFERDTVSSKLGYQFDLLNENFFFLLALGDSVGATSVNQHNLGQMSSVAPVQIIWQQNIDPIYVGCGLTKTCFGLPNNCVQDHSCQAIVTAVEIDARFQFELLSNFNNVAYVAFALSRDNLMGNDSTTECVVEAGTIRAYSSWNNPRPNLGNTRQGVPQNIVSLINATFVDGVIYCKFERETVSSKLGEVFDLRNENFHFLVSAGDSVGAASINWHNFGSLASAEPVQIIRPRRFDDIYEECNTTKTCFGLPANCVEQRTCQAVATAIYDNDNDTFEFELQSGVDRIAFVALGLSTDMLMGNDSVIECILPEGGGTTINAYTSWNSPRGNSRATIPQDIITLLDSSYIDGTIYCKVQRKPYSTKFGKNFNLRHENFHFLLVIGSNVAHNSVLFHDLGRVASPAPIQIGPPRIIDPIFDGCGETKTCFGLPLDCVDQKKCDAIVTAVAHDDDRIEFELQSGVDNIGYIAFGLSTDNRMGDDSVVECIPEGGVVRAYSSWNTRTLDNTRVDVPQDIITLRNSSYVNGTIYCRVEREPYSTKLGKDFNLRHENFHFMIAVGENVYDTSIGYHNLGVIASVDPIQFISAGHIFSSISIISIVVWFLVTSYTNYLRGF